MTGKRGFPKEERFSGLAVHFRIMAQEEEFLVDLRLPMRRRQVKLDKVEEDEIRNIVGSLNRSQLRELVVKSASHDPKFVKTIREVAGLPRKIPKPTPFDSWRKGYVLYEKEGSDWRSVETYPRQTALPNLIEIDDPSGLPNPFLQPYHTFNGVYWRFWISYGDGSGSLCSVPPRDYPRRYIHDIEFMEDGFFVDGDNYRFLDDPANEEFLMSLKIKELPKEFELYDGYISFHDIIMRKNARYTMGARSIPRPNYTIHPSNCEAFYS